MQQGSSCIFSSHTEINTGKLSEGDLVLGGKVKSKWATTTTKKKGLKQFFDLILTTYSTVAC